jgi:hypothetical protein
MLFAVAFLSLFPADISSAAAQGNPDFEKRVAEYVKIHKSAESTLPRLRRTQSPDKIDHHERELARTIRSMRQAARQGDIFTPAISSEFRKRIAGAMQGPEAARIRVSLKNAEPVRARLLINHRYPAGVPLQSTPPTLLLSLPQLPAEVEYRIVDHALVLLDLKANLVADFIPNAIP